MSELHRGVVKWFNDAKGFGFIEHTSGRDVFVHYSVIQSEGFKTLKDGEEVQYQLCEGDKGLHAARVVRSAAAQKDHTRTELMAGQQVDGQEIEVQHLGNSDLGSSDLDSAHTLTENAGGIDSSLSEEPAAAERLDH